jgi:Zn-finger nucleic acid-binding protein
MPRCDGIFLDAGELEVARAARRGRRRRLRRTRPATPHSVDAVNELVWAFSLMN